MTSPRWLNTQAENDQQYRIQNSIKILPAIGAASAIIYAGIAAFQLREMRKATRAAAEVCQHQDRVDEPEPDGVTQFSRHSTRAELGYEFRWQVERSKVLLRVRQ